MVYRAWPSQMPSDVEVCMARLPGREERLREAPLASVTPLVEAIGAEIQPLLDRPFAFFGHSMGALISFELARFLRREHRLDPAHLFVSGRRAPQLPTEENPTYNLPEAEFIQSVRDLNGTPAEVLANPELMQLLTPLLRADFAVCQTYSYKPEPPLNCGSTVYGGLQDTGVPRESLTGWQDQTSDACLVRMLPGDHFFLNSSQSLLLRTLGLELEKLLRKTPQQAGV